MTIISPTTGESLVGLGKRVGIQVPSGQVTKNFTLMATNGFTGPAFGSAFTGAYIAGNMFNVTSGGWWFNGYWWWCASGGQDVAPAGGFKCALWQINGGSTGVLVPGSVVSKAAVVHNQWNFIPLNTPLLLTPGALNEWGAVYVAAIGYTAAQGFPSTHSVFGAGNPHSGGITNGPLVMPSSITGSAPAGSTFTWAKPQMPFTTAGSDPSVIMPAQNDVDDNLWLDVQVTNKAPAGSSYRCFPNSPAFVVPGSSAQAQAYTLGLQFQVTVPCKLTRIWHYSPPGVTILPTRCGLWQVSNQTEVPGSDNSAPTWSCAAGSGWVSCTYANGPHLTPGTNYKVSTFTSDNIDTWFLATANWWGGSPGPFSNGITQGPLVVPGNSKATPGQDSWNQSPTWTYPGTSTNPEFDGLDVEVTPL
jgi:hypothetical protein